MPVLPDEFADLEPFAEKWCLGSEPERYAMRMSTPMGELMAFYKAITPRAEAAIAYCDRFPLADLSEEARNLLHLLYSMVMVSFPVEVWGQQRVPDTGATTFPCTLEPVP